MLFTKLVYFFFIAASNSENCSEIRCSNILDYVCGVSEAYGVKKLTRHQNICHFNRVKCSLASRFDIYQAPDSWCNITKTTGSRRVHDFSIIGAHQACNHSCPTYCVDTYEPACARIWTSPKLSYSRPMINHCHIDLLSCAAGVNVTIEPLARCYTNPSGLLFMMQIAALKSVKLIGDTPAEHIQPKKGRKNMYSAKNNE